MSRASSRGPREAGSIYVVVCLLTLVFVVLIFFMLHEGKTQVVRGQLQTAADSFALAAAAALREAGTDPSGRIDVTGIAAAMGQHHSSIPYQAAVEVVDGYHLQWALVKVTLTADYRSPFNLASKEPRRLTATSYARVHQARYGHEWPVVVVLLDASISMKDRVRGQQTVFELMTMMMERFTANPFPVRSGVVVYNDEVVAAVPPPQTASNNLAQVRAALRGVTPDGLTNIAKGLERARQMMARFRDERRDVILISDGKPTAGGHWKWPSLKDLSFYVSSKKAAKQQASQLRRQPNKGVSLFAIETRPEMLLPQLVKKAVDWVKTGVMALPQWLRGQTVTEYMVELSGGAMSQGNDPTYYYQVQDPAHVEAFLAAMARQVCAFGPVDVQQGGGQGADDQMVFAFLRDETGNESSLQALGLGETTLNYGRDGYEFIPRRDGIWVLLTTTTCYKLGRNSSRQVIIRWGEPELVARPQVTP